MIMRVKTGHTLKTVIMRVKKKWPRSIDGDHACENRPHPEDGNHASGNRLRHEGGDHVCENRPHPGDGDQACEKTGHAV